MYDDQADEKSIILNPLLLLLVFQLFVELLVFLFRPFFK